MQSQNRLFDDFVKMMNGAAGTFAGMSREAEGAFRDRVRDWIGGLDMVGRDEFEAVKAIAVAAREEAQALRARIDALETAGAAASSAGAAPRGRKSSGGAAGAGANPVGDA
jgi:BMFP domain-containing protein YqiC